VARKGLALLAASHSQTAAHMYLCSICIHPKQLMIRFAGQLAM